MRNLVMSIYKCLVNMQLQIHSKLKGSFGINPGKKIN